jgi:DNA-3-methyladenine glycosylase II
MNHRPQPHSTLAPTATPLTATTFRDGLQDLVNRDADLARVVARFGPPPLWRRPACFATLVRIILEQQVSLASAQAVFRRLTAMVVPFSAVRFRQLDANRLAAAGLTRQKRAYTRALAEAVATRRLRLNALAAMPDADARRALTGIRGIGPWSADIYLLMALKRPDIWPCGDLALNTALAAIKNLGGRVPEADLKALAASWHPWRAVAARILWHYYLSMRGRTAPRDF